MPIAALGTCAGPVAASGAAAAAGSETDAGPPDSRASPVTPTADDADAAAAGCAEVVLARVGLAAPFGSSGIVSWNFQKLCESDQKPRNQNLGFTAKIQEKL